MPCSPKIWDQSILIKELLQRKINMCRTKDNMELHRNGGADVERSFFGFALHIFVSCSESLNICKNTQKKKRREDPAAYFLM